MISSGDPTPPFELPAVADRQTEQVALDNHLREGVVVAFYTGDFNPACADGTAGLGELEVFATRGGVSVLGVSGDSVHGHRALAAECDLHVPLLADVRGDVATEHGVAVEDPAAGYLTRRADDDRTLPSVEAVQTAVENATDPGTPTGSQSFDTDDPADIDEDDGGTIDETELEEQTEKARERREADQEEDVTDGVASAGNDVTDTL
jgi:peroxiredoxin